MSRILDKIVPIIVGALVALFMIGLGWIIDQDMDQDQKRFEQCIAADMQWVRETCVK